MAWNNTKSDAVDPENPTASEKLDASEWNAHVIDQESRVSTVNGSSGPTVVLDSDDITEGATNLYYTEAKVSANTSVAANTDKVSNANHTGDVTGSTALTISSDTITEAMMNINNAPTNDYVLTADSGVTGGWKWASSASGFTDPMTARGDIIIRNSSNVTAKLAIGTNGQVISSDGTDTSWVTLVATNISDFDTEVSNNSSVSANTSKVTNVSTDLSEGTSTTTTVDVNSSDGTNATLVSASTLRAGLLTKAKFDEIVANNAKISYDSTSSTKVGFISITQAVDLDTMESNIATNNAKVSYTGTASDTELNILDGATLTTVELNYVDGVTSDIQTQLNAKGDMNDLVDDTTPQLGGSLDLNNKSIFDTLTVGEAVTSSDILYLKSDGKYWKADASAEATSSTQLVMAAAGISADASGSCLIYGGTVVTSGLTVGAIYYLSTSAGFITTTPPATTGNIVRIVGTAASATSLVFNPDITFIEVA